MGKLCSHPRKEAVHLANLIITSLLQEEMSAWEHDMNELIHTSGITVSLYNGEVYYGYEYLWMPILQRWRLKRAARQRAIQITRMVFLTAPLPVVVPVKKVKTHTKSIV